jgi:hypothetical protein
MADTFWKDTLTSLQKGLVTVERLIERADEGRVEKSVYRHHNGHRHGWLATQLTWGAKRRTGG